MSYLSLSDGCHGLRLRFRLLSVLLLSAVQWCVSYAKGFSLERDFMMLDTVVANADRYIEARQRLIDAQASKRPSGFDITIYTYYKQMFDGYVKFCSDSALAYAWRCRDVAVRAGLDTEAMLADIDLFYITTLQGNLYIADSIMRRLRPIDEYPPRMRGGVAVAMIEFTMRAAPLRSGYGNGTMLENVYASESAEVWRTYGPYLPSNSWLSDYYEAMTNVYDMRGRLAERLRHAPVPSVQAAMLNVAMARHCQLRGDSTAWVHYLVQSAVNDIMSANREASSLTLLLYTPYVSGNARRAAAYALASIKIASGYKDIARSFDIVKANSIIISDYMDMQDKMARNSAVIILLLVLVVVLALMLAYVSVRKSGLKSTELNRTKGYNSRLRDALAEVTEAKESIEQASAQRNALTLDAYVHMSDFINEVDKFCKTTANMITAGLPAKAHKALQEGCSDGFLPRFYASFDKWFLSVHPDFVERFLSLLKPEARTRFQSHSGGLSPEQRIYALVSLGITDSVSIAEFLHYSPQTIYNYRLRVRHCACIPEKDFAATVAAMYGKEGNGGK